MNHIVSDFFDDCFVVQANANYKAKMEHKREAIDDSLNELHDVGRFKYEGINYVSLKNIQELAKKLKESYK